MKLGFLNACLMDWSPEKLARFAAEHGFDAVELHGGPRYTAVSWPDIASGDAKAIASIRQPLEDHGIVCSGIMYGALPFLHPDPSQREYAVNYVTMLLRAAARLGVGVVSTFAGRSLEHDVSGNVAFFKGVFAPIVEEAEKLQVVIALENCAMTHGFAPATNIAYSPAIWAELFEAIPSRHLGLNFDPSHLQWMGGDVVRAAASFGDRIVHVQAKDAEVLTDRLAVTTILGDGWWRYRIPGYGEVPWGRLFSALREAGYGGVISIEHEDPVWTGSDDRVIDGLVRSGQFLRPFL